MKKVGSVKIFIVSICLLLGTTATAKITHKNCDKVCLTKVFAEKKNSKQQLILKLYCNNEYELLSFSMRRKKKIEYRETGEFIEFGPIFKLNATTEVNRIHKDYLFINKNGDLYTSFIDLYRKNAELFLPKSNDNKYHDSTYVDRYFGVISNIKSDKRKFIERPKHLWYDKYPENETSISKDSLSLINVVFVVGKDETDDILQRTLKLAEYVKEKV